MNKKKPIKLPTGSIADDIRNANNDVATRIAEKIVERITSHFDDLDTSTREEYLAHAETISKTATTAQQSLEELKAAVKAISEQQEEDYVELSGILDELQSEFEEKIAPVVSLLISKDGTIASLSSSLQDLQKQVDKTTADTLERLKKELLGVGKKHSSFEGDVKSLRDAALLHSKGVDDRFLKLEKDLKNLSGNIYSYGSQVQILKNGVLVGNSNGINFKAGSNVTLTVVANAQGQIDVTIASSGGGGGGFSTLSATETPNGIRTQFTFSGASAQPSYLVVDNVWMKAVSATGNTNWTWNNSTLKATLTVAPADDIWGVV